jgi:hypothetical protein
MDLLKRRKRRARRLKRMVTSVDAFLSFSFSDAFTISLHFLGAPMMNPCPSRAMLKGSNKMKGRGKKSPHPLKGNSPMKRVLLAVMIAVLGIAMLGTTANAAGPEQRGGDRIGKVMRRGGDRIREVAALLEMTPREILGELRTGATIEEIATEKGVPLSEIEAALAQPYRDRIAAQVADGVLTQAQADYLTTQAETRLNHFLTLTPRRALREPLLADLATVLEVSEADIIAQVEEGNSPAEIVLASGKGVEAVVAELVALKDADLTERVTLDLMTTTQKNRALRAYEQLLTNRLSE